MLGLFSKRGVRGLTYLMVIIISLGFGYFRSVSQNKAESKGKITIGYINWQEDVAVSYLWQEILRNQGYTVELKSLDVAPLFVGLSKGNLDLFLDAWLPITQRAYWDTYKEQLDDYGSWYLGEAKIGLVVPKYVNISSIEQLNNDRDKFKGQIIGIDAGAGIMKSADKAIKNYGLDYQLVQGSEAAMVAALDKAYREQKPVVITGWSPHWMFAKYDLKYLADSKLAFGKSEGLHTLANKSFSKKNPEVMAMLKKFKLDDQQIGTLEDLIQQGMPPQQAAKQWISENQELVDSWIK